MVYLSPSFFSNLIYIIKFEVSFLQPVHSWVVFLIFLKIYLSNLYLLSGVFRTFKFKMIIDLLMLKSTILLFIFCSFPLFLVLLYLSYCLLVSYLTNFYNSIFIYSSLGCITFYSLLSDCSGYYNIHL